MLSPGILDVNGTRAVFISGLPKLPLKGDFLSFRAGRGATIVLEIKDLVCRWFGI
jgi:hypothetical protein